MQAQTLKNARFAAFLNRSALFLFIAPIACLVWALQTYPPQDAYWLCFSLATYVWPCAGVLLIVSAGFHTGPSRRRFKKDSGFRQAHGH